MGLLLVCPKTSTTMTILRSLRYQKVERNKKLQIQGLVVRFSNQLKIGFLYSRSTMTETEVISTNKAFKECNVLMGDFNLLPKKEAEQKKLDLLCQSDKYQALKEITRRVSNNQPDHILVDKALQSVCYVTSYFNFISDHKSIVIRIGEEGNEFTLDFKQKLVFDAEVYSKTKSVIRQTKGNLPKTYENNGESLSSIMFKRKIVNPDMSSCLFTSATGSH